MGKASAADAMAPVLTAEQEAACARARESFWEYCRYIDPRFYREERWHLKELCDTLQALHDGTLGKRKLMISLPPRHGKSYTVSLFNQWCLGRDPGERIITVSYNETLSARFSRGVRNGIGAKTIDPRYPTFSQVFPGVRIASGDSAAQLWSLEGSYFSFLGAGFGGTITGVGCTRLIIDDPIKNHLEAYNEGSLREQWDYYVNTLLSRVEEGGSVVLIMTRWASGDLAGRALREEPDEWHVLCRPACADGQMLCPDLLSRETWERKKAVMAPDIFEANYQNAPIDLRGRLYPSFQTWETLPEGTERRRVSYTDTADTGADYLCMVCAEVIDGRVYVLDVLYTDEPMEVTESLAADMLVRNRITEAVIESNNGGRGFARNVERLLWDRHRTRSVHIIPKAQRQNKESRLLAASAFIGRNVFFPADWQRRFPAYHEAMTHFLRRGGNAHDDAPDATTGLVEFVQSGSETRKAYFSGRGAR